MLTPRLIERKRDGGRIEPGEWHDLLTAYLEGVVTDYQISALLMAIYFRGLDRDESAALTAAMLHSGRSLEPASAGRPRIDKHSTGGVGDKVSLVLAPLIASLDVDVPMMSGRALGHTGGTLDKLESIPGFRTRLSLEEAKRQLERLGCVLIGQSEEIAPADRRLYALRDATATVESIPLIAASIMSKKLAEGLDGLVLDVKRGSGAFLPPVERGLELAHLMVAIGREHGVPVVALLTAMDRPLGRACGNALEVEEAIHALRGEGPPDLLRVTYALGAEMLLLAGAAATADAARRSMEVAISSGRAAEKFQAIIAAQGGDPRVVDEPARLPQSRECELYLAPRSGIIAAVEPRAVGHGIAAMGGGRSRIDDTIDPSVGFVIVARPGDLARRGEPLATVCARDRAGIEKGMAALRQAVLIADEAELPLPLISHRVTMAGAEPFGESGVEVRSGAEREEAAPLRDDVT
ncbi:MAG TPA: thymidine phosphorylase [Gemmatimonadaceae bacterium]|nr:thymidine phosphorylase [Gemmatimonadaceae bacterium]